MSLKKAKFILLNENKTIQVHFNPAEYTIISQEPKSDFYQKEFDKKSEQLSLTLYFDTYMNNSLTDMVTGVKDVRIDTEAIIKLTERTKDKPPLVAFIWGSLIFKGLVTSVNQKYTMFMDDGKPVRAVLSITMQKMEHAELTSGSTSSIWEDKGNLVKNVRDSKMNVDNVRQLLDKF